MGTSNQAGLEADITDVVVRVPVSSLAPSDSPRTDGENKLHVDTLAASGATLPPIVVHRPSMRVIDGMHRLRTAQLAGQEEIGVRFFDGDDLDAFMLAVKLNVTHGLPLTRVDRKAAAARIVRERPQWSDRAIAEVVGLSPKTVGAVRAMSSEDIPQLTARVGRDGRVRPVRHRAPGVPEAGGPVDVLADTVRDVQGRPPGDDSASSSVPDVIGALRQLGADPSLRLTEVGRSLLRLLNFTVADGTRWDELAGQVPPHCANAIADLAQQCATMWFRFAARLRQRAVEDASVPTPEPGQRRVM